MWENLILSHGSFGGTPDVLANYMGKPCVWGLLIQ